MFRGQNTLMERNHADSVHGRAAHALKELTLQWVMRQHRVA